MTSESVIEKAVTQYAKNKGVMSIKLSGTHDRGKPDKLFLFEGTAFFIEFKATGKRASAAQTHFAKKLRKQGFNVFLVDSINEGRYVVDGVVS